VRTNGLEMTEVEQILFRSDKGVHMWWLRVFFVFLPLSLVSVFGLRILHWHDCNNSVDARLGTPPLIDCGPHPFEFSGDYRRSRLLNEGLIPPEELRSEELLQ